MQICMGVSGLFGKNQAGIRQRFITYATTIFKSNFPASKINPFHIKRQKNVNDKDKIISNMSITTTSLNIANFGLVAFNNQIFF